MKGLERAELVGHVLLPPALLGDIAFETDKMGDTPLRVKHGRNDRPLGEAVTVFFCD